jgi:hypothetical protein
MGLVELPDVARVRQVKQPSANRLGAGVRLACSTKTISIYCLDDAAMTKISLFGLIFLFSFPTIFFSSSNEPEIFQKEAGFTITPQQLADDYHTFASLIKDSGTGAKVVGPAAVCT